MSGDTLGRIKQIAKALGITVSEYLQKREVGQKWCTGCRAWHAVNAFGADPSRYDGLAARCTTYRRSDDRGRYTPKGRPGRRGWLVPARDGDVRQARRRVNYLVEQGLLAHPNTLACADCGHVWHVNERRHEYDHYLGYGAAQQLTVEAVCSACHRRREAERRVIA